MLEYNEQTENLMEIAMMLEQLKGLLPGRRAAQSCNQPEDNEVLRHICNIRRKRKRNLGVLRKLFSSHVCRC